uniref:Egg protein n=1 Tax=Elaeophora elaphi TaxID=1147741 RepID=A0A0R3RII2_9BILA
MKLFKIALIAVVMHTVEAKRQGRIAEKEMDGNLLPRNDCAEMVDQNKSVEQIEESHSVGIHRIGKKKYNKNNDFKNSTSFSFSAESENSEVTSTTSNVSSRTENDITDDALSSQSEESSELQLSMSKNGGRNKSQISVIDAVYLNEAESIALCQKALTCEEKLKWHELTCQRQHVYPNLILEPKTKLSDISVQAEFITNSGVADVMESVSKVCMKPITSDVLRQLSNLHRKIELSRKLCIRHVANNQNLLPIRNVKFFNF